VKRSDTYRMFLHRVERRSFSDETAPAIGKYIPVFDGLKKTSSLPYA